MLRPNATNYIPNFQINFKFDVSFGWLMCRRPSCCVLRLRCVAVYLAVENHRHRLRHGKLSYVPVGVFWKFDDSGWPGNFTGRRYGHRFFERYSETEVCRNAAVGQTERPKPNLDHFTDQVSNGSRACAACEPRFSNANCCSIFEPFYSTPESVCLVCVNGCGNSCVYLRISACVNWYLVVWCSVTSLNGISNSQIFAIKEGVAIRVVQNQLFLLSLLAAW